MKGLKIGHYSDLNVFTGSTVFLFERKNRAIASVRGGAPGSRELNALAPGQLVENIDALVFSGGSSFGIDSMSGAVEYLRQKGIGYKTKAANIPIVAGAVIYDLEVGESAAPHFEWVYSACENAVEKPKEGSVGVGTGASVGKSSGIRFAMKGGFGWGKSLQHPDNIHAFVVTNPLGDIYDPGSGQLLAGRRNKNGEIEGFAKNIQMNDDLISYHNSTLALIVLDYFFSREELLMLSHVVHSALSTCIRPYATLFDGDTVFMVSMGDRRLNYLSILQGLYESVTEAVIHSVLFAKGLPNLPSRNDIIKKRN